MTENKNKMQVPGANDAAEPKEEKLSVDFHFETPDDALMGIETAAYANGNQVKRIKLSDGRTAVVRELFGRDMMNIDKMLAAESNSETRQDKYFNLLYHFAVKVDGQQIPAEDFANLKGKDYNKIKITAQSLNF